MTPNPLLIIFGAAFVNNIVLVRLVGLCPLLTDCVNPKTVLNFGIATTSIMILTTIVNTVITLFVIIPYDLFFLRIFLFVVSILMIVHGVGLILAKFGRRAYGIFGSFIPALTMNCIVLAVSLISTDLGYNLAQGIAFAAGSGIGFTLVTAGFVVLRDRLKMAPVSPALKGYPLQFIAASLMALALAGFYGFLGIS